MTHLLQVIAEEAVDLLDHTMEVPLGIADYIGVGRIVLLIEFIPLGLVFIALPGTQLDLHHE